MLFGSTVTYGRLYLGHITEGTFKLVSLGGPGRRYNMLLEPPVLDARQSPALALWCAL
jgi:hypothetical protein